MNWGYKILILYLSFVGFIITFVVLAMMQTDIQLVAKDYYKKEIAYQEEIDKMRNVNQLNGAFNFNYLPDNQIIDLSFPKNVQQGEITFFRPSDAKKDFKLPLQSDNSGKQMFSTSKMDKGRWIVKINWNAEGKDYYAERKIDVK